MRILCGFSGSVWVLMGFQWLYAHLPQFVQRALTQWGKQSLGIFIVQHILLDICYAHWGVRFVDPSYLDALGLALLTLLLSLGLVGLLERFAWTRRYVLGGR